MPKLSPRFLLPALVLLLLLVGLLIWRQHSASKVTTTGMAAGTVVSSTVSGSDLSLTVAYVAGGRQLETTGTVSASSFSQQGKVVWVCFNPADTSQTTLRLPMDQLCANGG
ncbi:hypothetical protein ATK17_2498 [Branchiibius hedensis]|uniref:Uncharacterized protein n=1 Tax=Branchiibius hedensis TaxID=672460 RepID=A0A2Y9C1Y7_9MICO|nr:DUF3592 domain-containing protein [Branchiibius hedensis]PWJ26341.1 hypothetical protein ATK17_2498 [Branchiibius hedensis]SSA35153.1 hypothetical protein SAMN04489750_2498 [Branchiibius hedensis]